MDETYALSAMALATLATLAVALLSA